MLQDSFAEERAVVLTLKDKGVLDEEEDTLVNVNMLDDERYKKVCIFIFKEYLVSSVALYWYIGEIFFVRFFSFKFIFRVVF